MLESGSVPLSVSSLYDQDFYLWIEQTVQNLKERQFEKIDLENLIDEIESMGRSEKREVQSRLMTIVEHLLKLQYWQSERVENERGWRGTVIEQRYQLALALKDSPSLYRLLQERFEEVYGMARKNVIRKYQLPDIMFPAQPPFCLEDVLDPDYLTDQRGKD